MVLSFVDVMCHINFFFFLACGILVSLQEIKPVPPAVEAQSFNHWTARESPSH